MINVIEKVEKEARKLGLELDDIANENILEACTARVALEDNLAEMGINLDELEEQIYPSSSFVNQMIQALDDGRTGEEVVGGFIIAAMTISPEFNERFTREVKIND